MKNTQLRNSNKVLHNGEIKTIDGVVRGHVCFVEEIKQKFEEDVYGPWVDLDEVELINIDEKILFSCGFNKTNEKLFFYSLPNLQMEIHAVFFQSSWLIELQNHVKPIVSEVYNLNQLQNLVFFLSGKEIEVSL